MKFSAKMKVSASKSATSPSCKTLANIFLTMITEKDKLIKILQELEEISKDYSDGFLTPKEFIVKISDLKNYDFFIYTKLENLERELWTKTDSNGNKPKTAFVTVIKIENENVIFIPRIIREYLKEINQ